jgi:hypothetical protein
VIVGNRGGGVLTHLRNATSADLIRVQVVVADADSVLRLLTGGHPAKIIAAITWRPAGSG